MNIEILPPLTHDDDVPSSIDEFDKKLIKIVHKEFSYTKKGVQYTITASITRYGGLCVIASPPLASKAKVWQGDNILLARHWVRNHKEA